MSTRRRKRKGFAQKSPPFLTYLKNILRKYPDGGQILKELIQNADDAGASEVIFIHDERNYGTESLWSDDLLNFQGPALLAYNSATFSDDDWEGLQSTGQSLKFKDPNTVGRFGLGFNSVYHMTDLPGVFSGRHIGMLDPQRAVFDDGGFMWTLDDEEDRKEVESLSDQFLPFCDVLSAIERGDWNTIRESGYFKGTLFRFPLRSSPSEISDHRYSKERVKELFECFSTDVIIGLLFLRNVTQVSLKTIGQDGVVKHLLTASCQDDRTLENINSAPSELLTTMHVRETSLKVPGRSDEVCKWLVMASTVKDGSFQDLEDLGKKLHNIPTIGLAYALTGEDRGLHGGRLSCFLPLPDREENRTGFPVVINASFDLTDDRRSIKWVEMDQQHDDAAQWNSLLVEKLLPLVYCQAVSVAISLVGSSDGSATLAYGIWPDPCQTQHKERWHGVTEKISQNLWNMEVLCLAVDSTQWLKPSEAVFVSTMQDSDIQHALESLLLCVGEPLVRVPVNILETLQLPSSQQTSLKMMTPSFIRGVLRNDLWQKLDYEQKLLILEYVISDGQYKDLLGFQLLPLSDGTFIRFMDTDHDGTAFIESNQYPRLLLPGLSGRFLSLELKANVYQHLQKIGENKIFRNLVFLDKEVIHTNLPKALPENWISGSEKVTWHPGVVPQPPREWLQVFWKFLQQDLHALSHCEGYPLVPLSSIYNEPPQLNLVRLKRKSSLLFQNKDGNILAENTAKMLETVGCTVIRHWDTELWHENLSQYIMTPTSNNILKAFSNIGLGTVLRKLMEMTTKQKKLLCNLLSQGSEFSTDECKILSQLPMFYKLGSLQCPGSQLVAAGNAQALDENTVPAIPRDLVLPMMMLICRDEKDHRLLLQMGVQFLSASDVAAVSAVAIRNGQYIHQQKQAEKIMLWILRNGDVLFSQNNELRKSCENLSFIPCNGGLVMPSALFDPHVETFQELFESQRFPPKDFQEPQILKSLRTLGLKASLENITPGDILQVVVEMNKSQPLTEHQVKKRKATSLVRVCNDTLVLSICDSRIIQTLRSMAWVPPTSSSSKTTFFKPLELRHKKLSPLVEYSMPLTDVFNEVASNILGLDDSPPAEKIIENLTVLSHQYPDVDFYTYVMKLHTIYKYVQDSLTQFKNLLHLVKIWNSDGFSDPPEILLSYPDGLDLSCQIKKVPQAFLTYRELFLKCGVQETIPNCEIIGMLHKMMKDMQERHDCCGTSKELKLVISVFEWMKRRGLNSTDNLPVPVQTCKGLFTLKPLSTALFCDMPKEHLQDLGENLEHNIVHEDISYTMAAFLKLPLLSTNILKPEYFEPCGQSEPITRRIKNILREYNEEADLFKEMIQNADDAGATVCNFLVDMRQNLEFRNSLLDPAMASCHGPALWSYNNSRFNDEDFRNITRIGAATKELKVEKIGKFGLGFNTVYRVTDVPSILSGGSVIIFDPNANHLRKHIQSEANPGIKLNLGQHPHVLQLFADQFHPYQNIFGCDLIKSFYYDGTLIRLPFRTEEEAKYSNICNQSFNDQQIPGFINIIQESSKNVLVFLKGVQEVSLSILSPDSPSPNEHTLILKLCREQVHRWNIPEEFLLQSRQMAIVSSLVGKTVLDVEESTIMKVSASESSAIHTQHYLLHSSYGIGESLQMFQNNTLKKDVFSLPVAAIALPLMKNVHTGKWIPNLEGFAGQVFCFLPLPIFSGLPFHLNASFAVMSNRKSLWDTTEKGEWNRKLIYDAVCVTLARALALLQQMHKDGNLECYNYHTFWPDFKWAQSIFIELLKGFYQAVATGLNDAFLEVFSNGQKWCTIAHACFLISDIVENEQVGKTASQVFSALLPSPFVAVPLPEWVKAGFEASGCGKTLLQNTYNWERFYKAIVFSNLHCLAAEERDVLITHAIDMNKKEVDKLLKSVSCIPSTPLGTLQLISNLVHPQGKVAVLFEKEDGHFLQGTLKTYMRPDRLSRLELLGMLKDTIPIKQLMERAWTIAEVWKYDRQKACSRIRHVLELLKDLIAQAPSNVDEATFRNIPFLPAMLPRCSNVQDCLEIAIKKPTEIFHYKYLGLVNFSEPVLSKEHVGQELKFSTDFLEVLGLTRCPSIKTVMLQLEQAHKKSRILANEELINNVRKCYTYLNKVLSQDNPNVGNEIRIKAATFPFVLMGQECVPLISVAHKLSFEAAPYLYQLPKEYQQFDKLWQCVGLRDTFAIEDYMTVLKNIARKHHGKRLPTYELDLALNLIKRVSGETTDDTDFSLYEAQGMFLPDMDGVLRSADKLHYNDTPWLPCDNDTLLCHEMIPRYVALRFKVPTIIHKKLKNLNISPLSRWVSEFGAKEDIPRRIKNILNEYSSRKDILKELIQNADDSGATELHFIWDARTHPDLRTFGDEWKPLQGPALCIYNNTLFTNEDIDGIQQLGKGGKGDKLDTTGKYGLGFNVVYHLTDCPSFVTGDSMLCIFDPNILFLKTSSSNSPGAKMAVNHEFKSTFQDVYDTFLPDKFDLEHGTIFRLPLRTVGTVAKSQISNHTVSINDISELCEELKRDANNLILFLNNIQTITFSKISEEDGELQRILSIETKMSSMSKIDHVSFRKKLHEFAEAETLMNEAKAYQVFFTVEVKCSWSSLSTKWVVAKQIGIEEDKLSVIRRVGESLKYLRVPHGAVAACMNNFIPGRAFCTLPLPVESGLPVHISGNFIVDSARRDICKEDGGSAKTEWNSLLLTHMLAPLYCDLLEHLRISLIQSNTGQLEFENFQACESFFGSKLLKFFPVIDETIPKMWQEMVGQVYRLIYEKQSPLIPVYKKKTIQRHTSTKEIVTVEWSAVRQETVIEQPHFLLHKLNKEIEQALQNLNVQLVLPVDCLKKIFMEFEKAGVHVLCLCPETVCAYLRVQTLHAVGQNLPLPVSDTLLQSEACCHALLNYCLKVDKKKYDDFLNGLPLLVTLDGKLRRLCKTETTYHTIFSDLFPAHQHRFTSNTVVENEKALLLEEAGFLKDFSLEESAGYIKEHLGQKYCISRQGASTELEITKIEEAWLKIVWKFFQSKICKNNTVDETNNKRFQVMVSLFCDWAILPVYLEHKNGTFLFPLRSLKEVVYECSGDIVTCLSKLGFAKLNTALLPLEIFYHLIKPQLLQHMDCSTVLEILQARTDFLLWSKLTDWENEIVLIYLANGLSDTKNKTGYIYKLQYLPLFETIQGGRRSLNVFKKRYILETKLSKEQNIFQDLYQIDKQTLFLPDCKLYKQLAVDLNVHVFNDLQFLVHFLLPLLPSMHEKQLLQVLKLVQNIKNLYYDEFETESQIIFTSLGSMQFIRDEQGKHQRPSYFYNSEHSLYEAFKLHCRFIPEAFFKELGCPFSSIKPILLGLGMRNEVSDDEFIAFATAIEKDAKKGISVKLLEPKIKVLFSHMLQLKVDKLTNAFIKRVCIIEFLAPAYIKCDLQNIHPSYASSAPLIPLKGSIVGSCDDMLVWTCMAKLQTDNVLFKAEKQLLESFGVLFNPPVESVLQNLKNVCQATCKSKELIEMRFSVMEKNYNFLQSHLPFDSNLLKGVPVILVEDNALAEPSQVVISLSEDHVFRPYLFRVHPKLVCFQVLFQHIGVEAEPTVLHYGRVLSRIYKETNEKESPHGNQKKTILKATENLFSLVNECKNINDLQMLKPLYLPASDGRLYDSSTLVFNNCASIREISCLESAFKFLLHIENCSLFKDTYELENLLQQLPEDIRPKMLSQLTTETIHSMPLCSLGDSCELKEHLCGLLLSSSFQEALTSLLRSQKKGKVSAEEATKQCKVVFRKLEIICCEKIQTILLKGTETVQGSCQSKDVFIRKGRDGPCQVCIMHKDSMSVQETVSVMTFLAKEINGIMMNVLNSESTLILLEILTCKSSQEMSNVMKKCGILTQLTASKAAFSLPLPGQEIPEEWHDSLDMSILNSFKVGDYVGFMDPSREDVYLYALIQEQLESKVCGGAEVEMFLIDLGPGHIIAVCVIELYQFKIIRKSNCSEQAMVKNMEENDEKHDWFKKSLGDVKKEIDEQLCEIWKLSKKERTQSIRRLYLQYHPDKNSGQDRLANEICKYLQQKIRELEGNGRFNNPFYSNKPYSSSEGFSKYWSRWDGEASRHRQRHEDFTRRSNCEYDFWGYHDRQQRKPRPEEAIRWFQQAECDLRAASNDVDRDSPEWVLYKVHQAVKKALIAALCKKPGLLETEVPISDMASKVSNFTSSLEDVQQKVSELERLGVDNKKTQYPNYHPTPRIPNNSFPSSQDEAVLQLARDVLDKINAYVHT